MVVDLRSWLPDRAQALGFSRVRFASLSDNAPGIAAFDRFVAEGRQGTMDWLSQGRAPRADPSLLLPGVKSAAVLSFHYGGPRPPDPGPGNGRVASYAWGRDYHNLLSKALRRLCRELREQGVGAYWSADSRPVTERAWAERAGLGYIGKNGCAIVPGEGSWFFLAVVLLDVSVEPDPPLATMDRHCGSCRRCMDACPTQAITAPGQLDARRCISYLTIEHRGEIALTLDGWAFGCDRCQEVCPHNHRPLAAVHPDLHPRPGHAWLDLAEIIAASDEDLRRRFEGSPLRRPGPAGLRRNARLLSE